MKGGLRMTRKSSRSVGRRIPLSEALVRLDEEGILHSEHCDHDGRCYVRLLVRYFDRYNAATHPRQVGSVEIINLRGDAQVVDEDELEILIRRARRVYPRGVAIANVPGAWEAPDVPADVVHAGHGIGNTYIDPMSIVDLRDAQAAVERTGLVYKVVRDPETGAAQLMIGAWMPEAAGQGTVETVATVPIASDHMGRSVLDRAAVQEALERGKGFTEG
jgi:hypothetical protein